MNHSSTTPLQSNPPISARHVFQLGLDVDLHCVVTAIQCGQGVIGLAQKWSRLRLIDWLR